jgi:hypothetical protein
MSAVSALNSLRYNFGAIISPSIAGLIAASFSASIAYTIDLITFAASLIAVFMISAFRARKRRASELAKHHRRLSLRAQPPGTSRNLFD